MHLRIIKTWRISIKYELFIYIGQQDTAKSILRKDAVTADVWCKNSEEMCLHLRKVQPERTHADKTMTYQHIDPEKIHAKRMNTAQLLIAGCMKQHLFDYKPRNRKILS